jgi:riboflavin kinase/FMN adenylyltransferase
MATVPLEWCAYPPAECTRGAVTVGNFDGVHRGHQALVAVTRRHADRLHGPALVVTFDPPPHLVLHPDAAPRPPLTTLAGRANLLHAAGADHVVILRTTPPLLALSAEAFFEDVVVRQLGARAIIEGYDFRFGRGRGGTTATLRELSTVASIAFEEVQPVIYRDEPVSSSRVRSAIVGGDVARAAELLARPYRIEGRVIEGAKRGRTIGFPTANLAGVATVLPGNGVYAVRATVEGKMWPGAANVGANPTFGENQQKVEVHLIDFAGELYGKAIEVEFISRLRDTQPFASVEALVIQLNRDVDRAKYILGQS